MNQFLLPTSTAHAWAIEGQNARRWHGVQSSIPVVPFLFFLSLFISPLTCHELTSSLRNLRQKTRGGRCFLPRVFSLYISRTVRMSRFCSHFHSIVAFPNSAKVLEAGASMAILLTRSVQ